MNYTAVIIKQDEWFAGFVKEIPGVNSQGKTLDEVTENLKEAIQLILESNLKHNLNEYDKKEYFERIIAI
ncbi:MAG: hypothetical protein A2086_05975 [Spirochaetes bacterium GWD1_27_9]|nr:MAG: hypothetical protein A2Z98_10635 [Spirochaetes bacterium GWB1_27_13]OHD26218.1 MAG: hypothetical protein A2Y34_11170 [Spirochaetes bacterium GWC1_27_15]OHD35560.1 MAG: hypothetical protein A2086_05975 [Spirochaetes bacterium GWD1_27_9]